jgi:hypothetical protein
MAASLVGLGLVCAAVPVKAQVLPTPSSGPAASPAGLTMSFHKTPLVPAEPGSSSTLYFRKEVSSVAPAAWNAAAPPVPQVPDPLLALQAPMRDAAPRAAKTDSSESLQFQIPLELPGPQRLFKLDTEEDLKERMRQEARDQNTDNRLVFPDELVVSKEVYKPRTFPPAIEVAEPYYVCHGRLYFEQINSERYGWDLGAVQPIVEIGTFGLNLATLPYHMFTRPCERYECSAGLCLPGDPVPYLLYPPELSVTGAAAEGAALALLLAIFP